MNYEKLFIFLNNNNDKKYADFSKSLSNSDYQVIGVRMPILKDFVKKNYADSEIDPNSFELGRYLEIDYLYFAICLKRMKTIEEQLEFINNNIQKAKSWAITDMITSFIKKCSFELFFSYFKKMYNSKFTYKRRFAYVFALKFYKTDEAVSLLDFIREDEEYMVMMAEAWLLATMAITYPEEIYTKLIQLKDNSLKRKTISKINESFRVTDELKEKFKSLRN